LQLVLAASATRRGTWQPIYGQTAMVELLIAEGAKINTGNYDGYSPLRRAARQGHKDMVELLERHGAKE